MLTPDEGNSARVLTASTLEASAIGRVCASARQMKLEKLRAKPARDLKSLTLAVRRGDAAAFSEFYDLYSFRLYKYLLVLAKGNESDAREICQTVVLKVARRFKAFDREDQLWAWLAALARNAFIDHCRARERRSRFIPLEQLPQGLSAETIPDDLLPELLREILIGMPSQDRELIQAAYVDQRPLQALAEEAGQTYKAIESRLGRLRHKLKEHLLKAIHHERKL